VSQSERFESLVLGSGNGGAGRRTAVVERRYIGGSCHNINRLPSKNEIWSAKVADLVRHDGRRTRRALRERAAATPVENPMTTEAATKEAFVIQAKDARSVIG
jgi:pyruvate/2-oxoglutarate dehydrogenase complex dihydrolipoamide dehydrogenase (E3) component